MPIFYPDILDQKTAPRTFSYDDKDVMLYALGVGMARDRSNTGGDFVPSHMIGKPVPAFNLPAAGRTAVGRDPLQTEFASLGGVGGAKTHALTEAENGPHRHMADHRYFQPAGYSTTLPVVAVGENGLPPAVSAGGVSGSGTPHNNLQPYQVFNRIIKY